MSESRISPFEIEDTLRPLVGRDVELIEDSIVTRGPLKRFAIEGRPNSNQSLSLYVDWMERWWLRLR